MRIRNITDALASRWVILTIIIWVGTIMVFGFVLAYSSKNENLRNEQIELNQEIQILSEKKNYVEAGKKNFTLEDKKLSIILADLLSAGKQSGVALGEMQIAELTEHDNYRALPITISMKGDFNQIGKFVNLVEKNLQFQILDINVSTKETKGIGIICKIRAEFLII